MITINDEERTADDSGSQTQRSKVKLVRDDLKQLWLNNGGTLDHVSSTSNY